MHTRVVPFAIACLGLAAALPALAAAPNGSDALPVWEMVQGLLGGLALFLFGMGQMADALQAAAGNRMRLLLARVTTNRVTGSIAGAIITAIIQSSSVTTVLVVGFVTAGLMTVAQSVGVIIGANVGSTVTAQIIAFKVEEIALVLVGLGFFLTMLSKRDRSRQVGNMAMGIGLIFYGMGVMGDGMAPLRDYAPFTDLMANMRSPFAAIAVGALFTALVQSSAATAGIVITLAAGGLIPLEAGIALVFGANIGTCVTALLAAVGKSRIALRAATVHVLFNIAGVLLWLPFIPVLAEIVREISPQAPQLSGAARMAAEVPRQVANAHTIFNLANALLFLPLAGLLVRAALWVVPDRPERRSPAVRPAYLDQTLLRTPTMALLAARRELDRMAGLAQDAFERVVATLLEGSDPSGAVIHPGLVDLRGLHRLVLTYLAQLGREDLTESESLQIGHLVAISHNISVIADILELDLLPAVQRAREGGLSGPSAERGRALAHTVSTALSELREVLREPRSGREEAVRQLKPIIDQTISEAIAAETALLAGLDHPATDVEVEQLQAELAAIEAIKRVYTQVRRAARECVPISSN